MNYFDEINSKFVVGKQYLYNRVINGEEKSFKILSGICSVYPRCPYPYKEVFFAKQKSDDGIIDEIFFFEVDSLTYNNAVEDVVFNKSKEFNSDLKDLVNEEK